MDIKKKEIGSSIIINLDKQNYLNFLEKIYKLGQLHESKSNVKKLNHSILINAQKNPYMEVKGYCSRVVNDDGSVKEVIFVDYDNILFRLVEDEIKYLISKYNLTPFYIFTTHEEKDENGEYYGNYFAVCLTKKTFKEVIEIQDQLHCDVVYKKVPLRYRFKSWVLRISNKGDKPPPIFKCIIGDIQKCYNQDVSEAHLVFLKKIYHFPEIKYTNLDGNKLLYTSDYKTASK